MTGCRRIGVLLLQWLIGVQAVAADAAHAAATPQTPALLEALAQARFYSWGWVGTPPGPSSEEQAARAVAKSWSAEQLVQALPRANAEGKLYLLCVIRRLHPKAYAGALRDSGLSADTPVSVFTGTVLQTVPARPLIEQLERSRCEPLAWSRDGATAPASSSTGR